MASWIDLATTEGYAALLARINDRDLDAAKGFDPAKVTVTSPKTDTIRFNSASAKWEIYGGATWGDLVATYAISISGAAGSVPWSGITSKPTTLGGFGITDGQPLDGDLTAIAALGTTGFPARTAANTWALRTLTGPAAGLAVSNGAGVAGNPTLALANDLAALEGLGSTGFAVRTGTDAWAQRTLTAASSKIAVTNGNGVSGNPTVDVTEANLTLTNLGGTLTVAKGGTGLTTMGAKGAIAVATAAGTVAAKAVGTDGYSLLPSSAATDGLAWTGPGFEVVNGFITASVNASALTVALKGADGNDPSATNPVFVVFRNATTTTGTPAIIKVTAATSVVISNGSTLGAASATAFRLWIVGFNDSGTFRLGVVKILSDASAGVASIMALRDDLLLSSAAEGGLGGADSAQTIYTGTAVTTKALRIFGYLEWSSGLTTAGTWDAAPTKIQPFGHGVTPPGMLVQTVASYGGSGSTTTSTSMTDVTNGSLAITPTSACNPVLVNFGWWAQMASTFASELIYYAQVLRDAVNVSGSDGYRTSALASGSGVQCRSGHAFLYLDTPRSTSSLTYKLQHRTSGASGGATSAQTSKCLMEIMG